MVPGPLRRFAPGTLLQLLWPQPGLCCAPKITFTGPGYETFPRSTLVCSPWHMISLTLGKCLQRNKLDLVNICYLGWWGFFFSLLSFFFFSFIFPFLQKSLLLCTLSTLYLSMRTLIIIIFCCCYLLVFRYSQNCNIFLWHYNEPGAPCHLAQAQAWGMCHLPLSLFIHLLLRCSRRWAFVISWSRLSFLDGDISVFVP